MLNAHPNLETVHLLSPQQVTGTTNSLIMDRQGANGSLGLMLQVGAVTGTLDGSNKLTPTVQHSDDKVEANFTTVAAADLVSSNLTALDDNAKANKTYRAEYKGDKRYVRLALTETGAVDLMLSAIGVKSVPRHAPTGDPTVGATAT